MTELARKLCDELMGVDRNKISDESGVKEIKFYDRNVCKYYLASFCPHKVFVNTKSDFGNCTYKHHDEALKADYMINGGEYKEKYEREFLQYLQKIISDLDRKIRKAKERLETKPSDQGLDEMNPHRDEEEEALALLECRLSECLKQVEDLGSAGKIQEAQEASVKADKIREEMKQLKDEINPLLKQERELQVCSICGALLVTNDISKRLDTHYNGKQHKGYMRVREELKRLSGVYGDVTEYPRYRREKHTKSYRARNGDMRRNYGRKRSR